ncbi:MAG TPA: Do family serine endopeptidase [Polyangia bacterium]|jgi:serine protease Do
MRPLPRSLIITALLAWSAAGIAAATLFTQEACHRGTPASAAPPPGGHARGGGGSSSGAPLAGGRGFSTAFTNVAADLTPEVVRIVSMTGGKAQPTPRGRGNPFRGRQQQPFGGRGGEDPFEWFFRGPQPEPAPREAQLGSGVIVGDAGEILTNNHVVENADSIRVTLSDSRTFTAKVVGTDPKTDLALIRVQGAHGLPAARLGDSDALKVGEWVMAIGNPYGLEATVTAGVVSAKGRDHLEGGPVYEDFIQTDCNINPGNSGGPLVNLNGEVIGITTAIKLSQFGYTGIGFAIPANMARNVIDQLRAHGRVRRSWLGVSIQTMTPDLARGLGGGAPTQGALIAQVQDGSPAAKAGLQPGDIVTAIDGRPVATSKDLQRSVLDERIGKQVHLGVWRAGKQLTLAATTMEAPGETGHAQGGGQGGNAPSSFGLELRDLTPELAEHLHLPSRAHGAIIAQVAPGSPADEAGLAQGDLIVEVDRQPVRGASDAAQRLKATRPQGHLLRVRRGDAVVYVLLRP